MSCDQHLHRMRRAAYDNSVFQTLPTQFVDFQKRYMSQIDLICQELLSAAKNDFSNSTLGPFL